MALTIPPRTEEDQLWEIERELKSLQLKLAQSQAGRAASFMPPNLTLKLVECNIQNAIKWLKYELESRGSYEAVTQDQ